MLHMVGFSGTPASASLTTLAGLTDAVMTLTNTNGYIVPQGLNYIVGAWFGAVHMTRGQIQSPQLRELTQQEIYPIEAAASPATPSRFCDMRMDPRILKVGETVNVQVIDATGAEVANAVMVLSDGIITPVDRNDTFTCRFTNTTTLVANAWTLGSLTADQNIPSGTFEITGMRARSAGLVAARLILFNQQLRPGCVGNQAVGDVPHPAFVKGGFGVMGTFTNIQIPQVEFFSVSADTSQIVELDIHMISDSPSGF